MPQYCYGCMKPVSDGAVCACGYDGKQNHSHQLPTGTELDQRYVIGRVLGQGGFGITYIGRDLFLEKTVAIKEFYPHTLVTRDARTSLTVSCADDSAKNQFRRSRDRFLKEARTLVKLNEVPGIVHVQDACLENNTAYIVMEYLDGIDLKQYLLRRNVPMTAEQALNFFQPVLYALKKVHEQGLIHRDISPDNIMVLKDGNIKLLDFGAARELERQESGHTFASELVVKQGFAPIEQYREKADLGPTVDIYAVCASMYYCMTGRVPNNAPDRFMGNDNVDWKSISGLTGGQTAALEKGLAIRAEDRMGSIEELWDCLYDSRDNAPQKAASQPVQPKKQPEQPVKKTEKKKKKGLKRWIPALVAIQTVLLILCAVLLVKRDPARPVSEKNYPTAESPETTMDATESAEVTEVPAETILVEEPQSNAEGTQIDPYPAVIRFTNNLQVAKGKNLFIQVENGKDVTVTISNLKLKDSYLTNRSTTAKNHSEYRWILEMVGLETYQVGTSAWAFNPGEEKVKTLDEMEHAVYINVGNSYQYLDGPGGVEMTHTADSITWKFRVPEDHEFQFDQMKEFNVSISSTVETFWEGRFYRVQSVASAEEPVEPEPAWKQNMLRAEDPLPTFHYQGRRSYVDKYDETYMKELYKHYGSCKVLGSDLARSRITDVYFLDTLAEAPPEAWDVSVAQDQSVLAWTRQNIKRTLDLVIAGEGGVNGAQACRNLFYGYPELMTIHFDGNFHTEDATDMSNMFTYCRRITTVDLSTLDTSNVQSMSQMFYICENLKTVDLQGLDLSGLRIMTSMFEGCVRLSEVNLQDLDLSTLTITKNMFIDCERLEKVNLSGVNTPSLTEVKSMFENCVWLQNLDLRDLDTQNIVNLDRMFYNCSLLRKLDLSSWDTSKVTSMNQLFANCTSLASIDLTDFETDHVKLMGYLFENCENLTALDLSSFNTSEVTNMSYMFSGCKRIPELSVSHFDTSRVTNFKGMFMNCSRLSKVDVSDFVVNRGADTKSVFEGCYALNTEYRIMGDQGTAHID